MKIVSENRFSGKTYFYTIGSRIGAVAATTAEMEVPTPLLSSSASSRARSKLSRDSSNTSKAAGTPMAAVPLPSSETSSLGVLMKFRVPEDLGVLGNLREPEDL